MCDARVMDRVTPRARAQMGLPGATPEEARTMTTWTHKGFEEFSRGHFDNGGDNLYVNAAGVIETIHRFDVNTERVP